MKVVYTDVLIIGGGLAGLRVATGVKDRGFIEIKPFEKLDSDALIAQNAAYYLLSEMKKGEAEHSH